MKKPFAYITAAWTGQEFTDTDQAVVYCRKVYQAGFTPICPILYLPHFLNDTIPAEHKDGIDMARELLRRSHLGDERARETLIQGNLRLVLSVIQRFASRGENADDLFQVGCVGLIKAIDNFDVSQNVRFSTYGVPMIIGEIRRFLRDNTPIRVSRSVRDLAYHAMQAREALQKETGREPRVSEIAARVGSAPEQVAMALESIVEPASLYEPAYTDGDDTLAIMDRVQEASCEESWISDIMFKDTVQALTPRERRIIALRYLSGQTQMQVAQAIGISQAQVSRLEKCALNHIKEQISCR